MATSIESLGLSVEVQGVESANKALKQLVDVATRAEKAVTDLEAAADSAGKKTRELDKGASGAAEATRELDKGASGAATSTKALDTSAGSAAKSTGALDKGATSAAKATDALDKGAGKADKSTKGMGDSASKATAQVDEMGKKAATTERGVSSFASAALKAGAVLAAAFSVSSLARYADAWSDMQSKVGAATKDMEGAAGMMTRLVDIANASYSPLEQTVSTYSRNVTVLRDLGKSSAQAADYVESLNNMLVLTATRGERAASVQDALSKALATGKLEADGLETVLANGGEVAAALARELNTTTSGLRGLASQGKVTGKVIADAMIKSLDDVRERAAAMPATITDSFVILTNNVTELVGRLDKASGASAAVAGIIIDFAGALRKAGDYALAFGAVLAPAFKAVGSVISTVADNAGVVVAAIAGFFAPTVIAGIASVVGGVGTLAVAIGSTLVGAVKALTVIMLANPLGAFAAAIGIAGYAVYKFRDDIKQAVGVDVIATAKGAANTLIGAFAAAYEDIKFTWSNFGDILGGAVIGGVNLAIRAINSLIQGSISGVNSLVEAINKIPGIDISKIGSSVGISEMDNPYAGRAAASLAQRNAAVKAAMSRDYVGEIGGWLDGIGKRDSGSGTGGGSGGGAGTGGKSAKTVAIEAETDAIKRALKDQVGALEAANEQNDYIYGLGIKSAEEYYARKAELGRDIGLAEAAAAEKEIEVVNRALAANKLTEDQRKKLLEDRRKLVGDVSAATIKAFAAEVSAEEAAARKRTSLQSEATKSAQSATVSAIDQANALALQVEQYDMTATAIANANVARADEDLAIAETTYAMAVMRGERAEDLTLIQKEIEAIKQRAQALRSVSGSTAKLEALDASKELKEQAKKDNEQIGDSLTDALLRGFEDGKGFATNFKDTLINMFKTMILKPIIQPIVQGAANSLTNAIGLTDNQGGSSSFFDQAGNAKNLIGTGLSSISKYYGGAAASSNVISGAAASEIGSLVGGGAAIGGAGAAFTAGAGAVGSHIVTGAAANTIGGLVGGGAGGTVAGGLGASLGGAMSAIGAAMPYIGAAIAIYSLLSGSFKGEKRSGGTFNWADGQSSFLHGPSGGTDGKEGVVNAAISATAGGVNSLLKAAGSAVSVKNLIAGFEGSEKGRGGVMSGVTLSDGRQIGEDGSGSNYKGTYYNKNLPTSLTTEAAAGLLVTDLKQLQIEVLQSADDLPASLRKLVEGVTAVSLSDDAATALLGQISAQVAAVEGFRTMVESAGAPLAKFKDLSYDLTVAFVEASGGLEAAQNNLNSFYETYHTEAERMNDTLSGMTAVFDSLGFAVPATKEEFRLLVEGLSLTDETAVKARATLLGLNQTFAGWADYTKEQAEKVVADNKRITDQAASDALKTANFIASILAAARTEAERQADVAMGGLTRAVNVQKNALTKAWEDQQKVLQDGIDTASTALSEHQALSQRVKATLQNLFGQADLGMQRSVAQSQISDALASARSGGPLPTAASLESAFGVIAQPSQQLFKTFSDYQLDFLKTANDIAALGDLTDAQISVEERTLNVLKEQLIAAGQAYKAQIEYYDSMLTKAQEQIDAALGNTQATLTVSQAMTAFTSSIANLVAAQATKPKPTNGAPSGLSSGEQAVWDAYQGSGIGYLDQGGWEFWNEAIKNGADPAAIAAEIAAINAGKVNGSHANGLDRVPFDGYTAMLHEGERVKTKQQARDEDMQRARSAGAGGVQDAESLRVLQQLLMRLNDMGADTRAIAQNTGRWARLSERWDGDGVPPTRDEMV